MNSDQIKKVSDVQLLGLSDADVPALLSRQNVWLKEIAYQLAVSNETKQTERQVRLDMLTQFQDAFAGYPAVVDWARSRIVIIERQ